MTKPYSHQNWKNFRQEVMELDGHQCRRCMRGKEHAIVLQVHHKHYVPHRMPWEYNYDDCETLCKGCHGEEHGHVCPKTGWDYLGDDDLGSLCGSCDLCNNDIRYVYFVHHPQWEPMGVGTVCCDNLTGTKEASNLMDARNRLHARAERFINSHRWVTQGTRYSITQKGININIYGSFSGFQIQMNGNSGKQVFQTIELAKKKVFDVIDNGEAEAYLRRVHRVPVQAYTSRTIDYHPGASNIHHNRRRHGNDSH